MCWGGTLGPGEVKQALGSTSPSPGELSYALLSHLMYVTGPGRGSYLSSWTLPVPTKAAGATGPHRTLLSISHTGTSQEVGTGPQASWAAASVTDS